MQGFQLFLGGRGGGVILFCNIDREYKTQPDGIIAKHILKPVAFLFKCNFNEMHDFCFYTFHWFLKFWYLDVVTRPMLFHTATSRKVVRKNVNATIPKGNMGYDQYTVPDTVAVEPTFVAFL